jgi:hypothetical protein
MDVMADVSRNQLNCGCAQVGGRVGAARRGGVGWGGWGGWGMGSAIMFDTIKSAVSD